MSYDVFVFTNLYLFLRLTIFVFTTYGICFYDIIFDKRYSIGRYSIRFSDHCDKTLFDETLIEGSDWLRVNSG